jgi:hypothetical protein
LAGNGIHAWSLFLSRDLYLDCSHRFQQGEQRVKLVAATQIRRGEDQAIGSGNAAFTRVQM